MTPAELIDLLREARESVVALADEYELLMLATETEEKQRELARRIDAALAAHDDRDPFSASYQRAFVNGCDVQIERECNGTWRWHVRKSRAEAHALLDGMREIARGPAATESQAKMLALEVARSAR